MEKQAIMLKQEIVAAFMECEDGGDYLESGIKKFERKLDEILTAHEEEGKYRIAEVVWEEYQKDNARGKYYHDYDTFPEWLKYMAVFGRTNG